MEPNRELDFARRQTSILGSIIFASRWLQVLL